MLERRRQSPSGESDQAARERRLLTRSPLWATVHNGAPHGKKFKPTKAKNVDNYADASAKYRQIWYFAWCIIACPGRRVFLRSEPSRFRGLVNIAIGLLCVVPLPLRFVRQIPIRGFVPIKYVVYVVPGLSTQQMIYVVYVVYVACVVSVVSVVRKYLAIVAALRMRPACADRRRRWNGCLSRR